MLIKYYTGAVLQQCPVASGAQRLPLGYLDNVSFSFFIKIICWVTYILKVLSTQGPRQIFLIAQPLYRVLILMIFDMFSKKRNPLKKISVLQQLQALLLKTGSFNPSSHCRILINNVLEANLDSRDLLIIKQSQNEVPFYAFFPKLKKCYSYLSLTQTHFNRTGTMCPSQRGGHFVESQLKQ